MWISLPRRNLCQKIRGVAASLSRRPFSQTIRAENGHKEYSGYEYLRVSLSRRLITCSRWLRNTSKGMLNLLNISLIEVFTANGLLLSAPIDAASKNLKKGKAMHFKML